MDEPGITEPVESVEDLDYTESMGEEPFEALTTEDKNDNSDDSLSDKTKIDTSQVWSLILDLMSLKQNQEKVKSDIKDIQHKLNIIFDSLRADTLSLATGTVRRDRSDKGETKWIIDV